jgi:hypothetical protein
LVTRIPGSEAWVILSTVHAESASEFLHGDGTVRVVVAVDFEMTEPDGCS